MEASSKAAPIGRTLRPRTFRGRRLLLLAGVPLVAALLRFAGLGAAPLWTDEGFSVWFSSLGRGCLWSEVPRFDNHPSLYFLILKAWLGVAGSSEFALRVPSAVASLGVVALLFVAGRILGRALDAGGGEGRRETSTLGDGWAPGARPRRSRARRARPGALLAEALGEAGRREAAWPAETAAGRTAGRDVALARWGADGRGDGRGRGDGADRGRDPGGRGRGGRPRRRLTRWVNSGGGAQGAPSV